MKTQKSMSDLDSIIKAYEQIFDSVRVIDLSSRKTLFYKKNPLLNYDLFCSEGIGEMQCNECISQRALLENRPFTKLHFDGDQTFLLFATVVEANDKAYLMELIKRLNEDFVFEIKNKDESHKFRNILDDFNQMLSKDDLTGVYNRRYIDKSLPGEIERATSSSPLSIAMVDIDFFKEVNDTYGHSTGDIAIKAFSQVLLQAIRKNEDWVARYGGEEFLICLPSTNAKQAYRVLERIRKKVEAMTILTEAGDLRITSSFGLFTIENSQWTAGEIIHNADLNLYRAKRSGRNIVK